MSKGSSLIEVLVALVVIMGIFIAASKASILSIRTNRYSEAITYASALGHTKLVSLKSLPLDSSDLDINWHQDPENPIVCDNMRFYRFWQVNDSLIGREVHLYVAWDDHFRNKAQDFSSLTSLEESRCPRISFRDVFLKE